MSTACLSCTEGSRQDGVSLLSAVLCFCTQVSHAAPPCTQPATASAHARPHAAACMQGHLPFDGAPATNRAKPLLSRFLSDPAPAHRGPASPPAVTQPQPLGGPSLVPAEALQPPPMVSQEQVYEWVVAAYISAGLQRRLSNHDYKVPRLSLILENTPPSWLHIIM